MPVSIQNFMRFAALELTKPAIDQYVYCLYAFTPTDIQLVEGTAK
jgi:hypothetical protein